MLTWLAGFALMLVTVIWQKDINLGRLKDIGAVKLHLIIYFVWLVSALIWSLGFVLLPYIYKLLSGKITNRAFKYSAFAMSLMISEWLRSVIFSLINYGKGATIGPFWSFGSFGLSLTNTPLVYASRIVGLFGLSFIGLILIYGIWLFARKIRSRYVLLMVLLPIIVFVLGWLWPQKVRPFSATVTIVHKPYSDDVTPLLDRSLPLDYKYSYDAKQLVVLSEYSGIFQDGLTESEQAFTQKISGDQLSGFIDTVSVHANNNHYNQIGLYQKDGTLIDSQQKKLLIPGGEYLPYYLEGVLKMLGSADLIDVFKPSVITKNTNKPKTFTFDSETLGAQSCSASIAPDFYRELTRQNASLLINSADLGFFYKSKSYYTQNLQLSTFEAVSNARPFVQATTQGPSLIITKDGQLKDYINLTNGVQIRSYKVDTNNTRTPYTLIGEWVAYLGLTTAFILVVRLLLLRLMKTIY